MITKLDRKREQMAEREVRAKNLESLNRELKEARNLLAVIPTAASDYEAAQERRIVAAHIRELSELAADEQRAYDATFEDEQTAADVVARMGL